MTHTKDFLKEHAVYQIYPISFKDSNQDGKGDLKGITSKLDYLHDIGIRIIWLSPIYCSPMVDFGYDISDYRNINPIFGTMDDFDELMKEATKRDIKIIMDLVVNHTSDQHEWFKSALKDKNSPYRDYYIFKQGKKNSKGGFDYPNNWESNFTGPAWEEVPGEEGMFYLHIFTKQQPDLNWHNPQVLKEVEDIISFWMDKGVYGFRCDVISEIYKESFEDGKPHPGIGVPVGMEHYLATQGNHDILKKISKDVIEPRGGVLIGECGGPITIEDGKKFMDKELDTFFQFETCNAYKSLFSTMVSPKKFKKIITRWQENIPWLGNYLENHDQRRVFTHHVKGKDELYGAKMLLTMQYTLKGTPFIYMGQEFATHNYPEPLPLEECQDIVTNNIYKMARSLHLPKRLALKIAHKYGRDDERAPLAFSSEEGFGFSSPEVKPWQRYNPLGKIYNAKDALNDPDSVLCYFKKLNELRQSHKVFTYGDINFKEYATKQKDVLIYTRKDQDMKVLVILNLSSKKRKFTKEIKQLKLSCPIISNYDGVADQLRPYEALVFQL